ncbi:hypothetical protein [Alkaliphilus sp. B6464]|uniref:hypothetical protein n=1 Tax=Alkaliphilus sp. B6464 TaxID=2731219 RepID=UPI001BA7E14F|nr:hypothetical protein [Alkaliphilus sp. B6464]QUH20362.1 hypothetical protein HYG84_10945 [Alkaliphilus sp. B6464]
MQKTKLTKVIKIITIITSIVTVLYLGFRFLIPIYLSYRLNIEANKVDSIGIMGGADGATTIFLTSVSSPANSIIIICALFSMAGIAYLVFNRKVMK